MPTILGDDTIENLDDDEDPQQVAARLIQLLSDDFERVIRRLMRVNFEAVRNQDTATDETRSEFYTEWRSTARDAIRSFFAYVEGTVYSLKVYAMMQLAVLDDPLPAHEVNAVLECTHSMSDRGVMRDKAFHIAFFPNLLFMINLQERLHKLEPQLDKSAPWWTALNDLVSVRDRLMHPKHPNDLELDGEDMKTLMFVRKGFNALLERFLGPQPWTLPDAWEMRPELMPDSWIRRINELQGLDESGNPLP